MSYAAGDGIRPPGRLVGPASVRAVRGLPSLLALVGGGLAILFLLTTCSGGVTGLDEEAPRDTVTLGLAKASLRLVSVSGEDGRVLNRLELGEGDTPRIIGSAADRERREVILRTFFPEGEQDDELMAVSTSELDILWREPVEAIEARSAFGSRMMIGAGHIRVGPRGRRIFVNAGIEVGNVGVLVLERETRSPLRFIGGFERTVTGICVVGGKEQEGLLVVAGDRGEEEASRALVYDLEDLTVRDSFPGGRTFVADHKVLSARDGRHFYFVTADSLFKIDARQGEIVNKRRRVRPIVPGDVAVTTNPERLHLTDGGGGDLPGSGQIQVYDGELNDLGTVSLRSDELNEDFDFTPGTPAMAGIAVSEDEKRLYLASGVKRFTFDQPAALFVVDVQSLSQVAVHPIADARTEAIHAF